MLRFATALAALALGVVLAPSPAEACGGFFCSSRPIDQSGETIVYGMEDDGSVTMAVQVEYQGMDDDFAWILPVVAPPESITVGSQALFTTLRAVTEPTFVWDERWRGVCRSHPRCVYPSGGGGGSYEGGGCGGGSPSRPWSGGYVDSGPAYDASARSEADTGVPDMGVRVFSEDLVGPYDTVTLGAATAEEVVTWLREHDYDVPEDSIPLLQPYAEAGHVFVALRLSANRDSGVLRPVVLRIPTREACLPIRLTAIASTPRLPITALFLGREGVAARNYSAAQVDTLDPGFWDGSRSYEAQATLAIDELGGQAFTTDYSGPTPAVTLELPSVADLATAPPTFLIRELAARGYPSSALLLELFERYIEPPTGSDPRSYYDCLFTGSTDLCGEPLRYDPEGLAAAIQAEIREPRAEAQALVNRHGHLTRLWTSLAVEKMTLDPIFMQSDAVPEVSNVHEADQVIECSDDYYREDAPRHWEIDGETFPIHGGTRADDEAYCSERGGAVEGSPEAESFRSSRSDDSSGGCDDGVCAVAGAATTQSGFLFALVMTLLVRRARRHRR